ncbi:MAG TPA: hypothetical protein DCF33_17250 [Saprospirales bacterium]|nr:hypothetical protein [Saprospirales bacterium]
MDVESIPIMSDFLKKFKSVFIVEDESTNTAPSTEAEKKAEQSTPPATTTAPVSASGSISDKFLDALATAMERQNQEGFDYFEFRQALKNLSKMSMDEQTRFQSAFAMAQTMGITAAKLAASAQHYLGVLNGEKQHFAEAHAQQIAKLVGNREEEAKNLEVAIQQKEDQIKKLTEEIAQHRLRSEQIRQEISESTVKIEATKGDFEVTFQAVYGQVQEDLHKIQQFLK